MERTIRAIMVAVTTWVLAASTPGTSAAVDLVGVTEVTVGWEPASGAVASYGVYIARNGEPRPEAPAIHVPDNRVVVSGNPGDALEVWVAAFDEHGIRGPVSPVSDLLSFVAGEALPAPAGALYFDDFEGYEDHEDPMGWIDTGAGNALVEEGALFETIRFSDGSVSFGTSSRETNIHSHYVADGSDSWSAYEVSGEMAVFAPNAGIGVTLYSDYPVSDSYYRLRRFGRGSFQISSHPEGAMECQGETDTGVKPRTGGWYTFRFQAFPAADTGTRLRAKVWPRGGSEPDGWQTDCVDVAALRTMGAPGVWSMGKGIKTWNDFEVSPLTSDGERLHPESPSEDPDGDLTLHIEDFESYADGADPLGWFDTAANNALVEQPSLFETVALDDGTKAFGTTSTGTNVHSHYTLGDSGSWSAYEFEGALAVENRKGGIGVTLYSDYPESDTYYRLRRYDSTSFHLSSHGVAATQCQGTTDTGVVPLPGVWYRFRFQAQPEGDQTRLRARVWESGGAEPGSWQIDCLDADAMRSAGAPGVWSMGPGLKLWDEFRIRRIEP